MLKPALTLAAFYGSLWLSFKLFKLSGQLREQLRPGLSVVVFLVAVFVLFAIWMIGILFCPIDWGPS